MKKALSIFLISCFILANAANADATDDPDCSQGAKKVVDKLNAHHITEVTLKYSADKSERAKICEKAILAKNSNITIHENQVSGNNIFKFSR
jgi:hypothetical protein